MQDISLIGGNWLLYNGLQPTQPNWAVAMQGGKALEIGTAGGLRALLPLEATERVSAESGEASSQENAKSICATAHEPLPSGVMCFHVVNGQWRDLPDDPRAVRAATCQQAARLSKLQWTRHERTLYRERSA